MIDAEPLIDLSEPRHHEQVTPRGRRRRRAAMLALAAVAALVAGGAGYTVVHRAAAPATAPVPAPTTRPAVAPDALTAPGDRPSPGLDPVRSR
ncbi:hypothetical protein [Paractinoplanes toevensis]|uniref:Uncharacterized protein n=1 Tax=Paractinoplanes toevensis TaxID=571911 RepID=A0A919W4L1_9ACTN|nr:hypothetical protein [Actinoplanes toevensis]GIM90228.1 hypothetical protein Ato02nite_020210 [Actinoplanes toevensis]